MAGAVPRRPGDGGHRGAGRAPPWHRDVPQGPTHLRAGRRIAGEAGHYARELEFLGEIVGATIIFGEDDAEPILGVTALESAGIEVDPRTQRLKRLPAVRLK